MNMRILTYNIHHGTDKAGEYALEKIINFLSKSGADLVGLQEADRFAKRSNFIDQFQKIKTELPYNAFFAPSLILPQEGLGKPEREYGLMSLSRFPVVETKTHFLRKSEYAGKWFTESRICIESVINANGMKIAFLNLHIDTHEIEKQIENLSRVLEKIRVPKILVGDFNIPPENGNIKLIQEKLKLRNVMAGGMAHTHEDDRGKKQIDYIFVSEEFTVKEAKVLDVDFSDHKPLVAEVFI